MRKGAVDAAISQAKREHVELIVQKKDHTIGSKDSHGNDPIPPKNKEH